MKNLEKNLTNEEMNDAFPEIASSDFIQQKVYDQVYKKENGFCIENWDGLHLYDSQWKFIWLE